jgi:hypothetical protein
MGLKSEMKDMWERMSKGDPTAFLGLPKTGTGASTPEGNVLTERERQMLMRFFHEQYGRYPVTDFEFQNWLRDNWY